MKVKKTSNKKYFFLLPLAFSGLAFLESVKPFILENSPKEIIDHVFNVVFREFVDPEGNFDKSKWWELRNKVLSKKNLGSQDPHNTIRQMLASLNDPYTRFLDPSEFNQIKIDLSGELIGVGIQIAIDSNDDLIVVSPIEGSPAIEEGIKPEDKIISIDNISTKGMNIEKAVQLIRGEKGTKVKLVISRNGIFLNKLLLRKTINIKSVSSKLNSTKNGYLVGYIRINKFGNKTSDELRKTLIDFENKNISGYVLDLRWNPGGSLNSSIEISRQFIDKGIIVSTLKKDGLKKIRKAKGVSLTKKPLIVLVNQGSASASEIVSGAIKDNNRGKLVGKKTFGKGLVQQMFPLRDGSAVTLTIAKYLTPNGTDINKFGITPDIEVKMNSKPILQREIGTRKDRQYRVGENELIKIIERNKLLSYFDPNASNLLAVLNNRNSSFVYSLN